QYVACVVQKLEDTSSSGDYDYTYLCVASSTSTTFTLLTAPTAGATLIAYFAYVSSAEAGGYVCQTAWLVDCQASHFTLILWLKGALKGPFSYSGPQNL
ncbi:hypothetical protein, partial [Mesomycoplasma ovipneumoniae]|uniref:hypothetical protein n=1 Tax=Mesomycoplasma ovipneumoniae TaxID=29562 RepID=UPI00308023A1